MNNIKICFVGIGSIAKRHIYNIKNYLNKDFNCQIDAYRSSYSALDSDISKYIANEYYEFDDVPKDYDAIFITNPTKFHYDTLELFIENLGECKILQVVNGTEFIGNLW